MLKKFLIVLLTIILLVIALLIGWKSHTEVYKLSNVESKNKPLTGHIIDIQKNNILVATNVTNEQLKEKKPDELKKELFLSSEMGWFGISDNKVLKKMKFGQKVTVYDDNATLDSSPLRANASKIIIYK